MVLNLFKFKVKAKKGNNSSKDYVKRNSTEKRQTKTVCNRSWWQQRGMCWLIPRDRAVLNLVTVDVLQLIREEKWPFSVVAIFRDEIKRFCKTMRKIQRIHAFDLLFCCCWSVCSKTNNKNVRTEQESFVYDQSSSGQSRLSRWTSDTSQRPDKSVASRLGS